MSSSVGKLAMIAKLATHWAAGGQAEGAAARIRFGNISPSSTQTTGPQDMPNATTNRLAAISAIEARPRCGCRLPAAPLTHAAPCRR